MIRIENDCCDCGAVSCDGCRLRRRPHYYCDVCEDEFQPEDLFKIGDEMICQDCAEANISYRELLEDIYGTVG